MAILERKIRESQDRLSTGNLNEIAVVKEHLALMAGIDQDVRHFFMKNRADVRIRELMSQMDQLYTTHMKAILQKHRWIVISQFGAEADHQAWLLVQHADHDPDFQRGCLKILEDFLPSGEINKQNYAYLYDRVALKDVGKQRYGTQLRIQGDEFELLPTEETLEKVESYRRTLGLSPLEEYLKEVRQ